MELKLFTLTLFWVGMMVSTVGYVRHSRHHVRHETKQYGDVVTSRRA
jgi:hypothetical protein